MASLEDRSTMKPLAGINLTVNPASQASPCQRVVHHHDAIHTYTYASHMLATSSACAQSIPSSAAVLIAARLAPCRWRISSSPRRRTLPTYIHCEQDRCSAVQRMLTTRMPTRQTNQVAQTHATQTQNARHRTQRSHTNSRSIALPP